MARIDDDRGHKHLFGMTTNRCVCGAVQMHRKDYALACEAWDKHYEEAKGRVPNKSFEVCAKAFAQKNLDVVRECARRATERLMKNDYPRKPMLPDPRNHNWKQYLNDGKDTDYLIHDPIYDD